MVMVMIRVRVMQSRQYKALKIDCCMQANRSVNATRTEQYLIGRAWDGETLEGALELLAEAGGGNMPPAPGAH